MTEDSFEGESQNALFGVFDGHCGDKAADYCSRKVSKKLAKRLRIFPTDNNHLMKEGIY